jgi:GNAT superfamily N-acetyltransferase
LKDTVEVLKASSKNGIWNHGMIIFGFPTETNEEAEETIRFLELNADKIHSSIFFRFSLLKNSHVYNNPKIYSIEKIHEPENKFFYEHPFECEEGMKKEELESFMDWAQKYRIREIYGYPAWFYMRIREYLFIYLSRFPMETVWRWKVDFKRLQVFSAGQRVSYGFLRGEELDHGLMKRLKALISLGGEVGVSWVDENLKEALWVGYAEEAGRIVATMSHKRPKQKYLDYLLEKTGLDLSGYLERGYSFVRPEYRGLGIGDRLLKGLVERSPGQKIYVTSRLDNIPAIRLTRKNGMVLKAEFINERTGHRIGVFVNG